MHAKFSFKFHVLTIFFLTSTISLLGEGCSPPDCCEPSSCGQFNIGVEWLYWKVKEDNLRAGSFIDDFPATMENEVKVANGTVIQPGFEYNSGFRANIGYAFSCNQWELCAFYTYVPLQSDSVFREVIPLDQQTEAHRQFIVPNIDGFPSFKGFSSDIELIAFTSLLSKWNGNLSYVDIDLSRQLNFNNCFILKPHIGFRAAWMSQHLHMEGRLLFPSFGGSTFGSLKYSEKFHGYGIEGGVLTDWRLGCGFAIIGHVGGSILYSRFKITVLSESSIGEDGVVVFIINSGSKEMVAVPTMDYFAGLKYETCWSNLQISALIGWEQRVFFYMNQISVGSGCLSLQGLTLGGNVAF